MASVSRVFNQRPNVREKVKNKVLAAADALGYTPKQSAVKDCYAILVSSYDVISHGGYGGMLLAAVMKEISQRDGRIEIITTESLPLLKAKFFIGVISTLFNTDSLLELKDYDRPVVTINTKNKDYSSVCSNEYQGLSLAIDYLISMGHSKIALQSGGGDSYTNLQRLEAFRQLISEKKLPVDDDFIKNRHANTSDWELTAGLLKKKPTAIIATGEEQGPILSYNLSLFDKQVPDEISVISFEHSGISNVMIPPQTTLVQNFEELSTRALDMLETEKKEHIQVDYKLIKRDSVSQLGSCKKD